MKQQLRYPTLIKYLSNMRTKKGKYSDDDGGKILKYIVEECQVPQPFILMGGPVSIESMFTEFKKDTAYQIDLPFETCIFENTGEALIMHTDVDEEVALTSLFVAEVPEGYYFIFEAKDLDTQEERMLTCYPGNDHYEFFCRVASKLCTVLHDKETRLGNVRQNVRVRTQGNGSTWINKVICISPTKIQRPAQLAPSLPIEWSHSWTSCGHWRVVKGVGKNRRGEYCIPGSTWVKPSVKGAKDQDPTHKTRIVQAQPERI